MRQDLAGALDHAHRQRGQARDFDAVAAVGGAGLDAAQEQDLVAGFLHRNVQIADAVELSGELGQLVIVRREESFRADVAVDVLDHGPGERQSVVGGRAAADFVEHDQAARRSRC